MDVADERDLAARIARGDRVAVAELLEANEGRLFNVCLRMVGHRDDAAELTQDAMVRIVQHLGGYRGDARLTTWMTRIAMNGCLSFLRKRRLRSTVSLHGGPDPTDLDGRSALAARLADHREPAPEQRVELEEQLGRLHVAMGRLDPDHRAVLVLRDLEQMDYREIAEALELPVGTVKSRLFRARLALRGAMEAPGGGGLERAVPTGQAERSEP